MAKFCPDRSAFAEVCYLLADGGYWRAVVYCRESGWEVKFGRTLDTTRFIPAGMFLNTKELMAVISQRILDRIGPDVKPLYDTLHKLKVDENFKGGEPSVQSEIEPRPEKEPLEKLLARLQKKMRTKYGES